MLDLSVDVCDLTQTLVDIESVSGNEAALADLIQHALLGYDAFTVERDGNVVLARTGRRNAELVALAGHLDTVPVADNLPSRLENGLMYGCGTTDMKSGVAVALRIAHLVGSGWLIPTSDLSWVLYDCEEVAADRNGLGRLARERPDVLAADLAVLLEPTDGVVEGGCQGNLRATVTATGRRSHSARSWVGVNAIHAVAPVLDRLSRYTARTVDIDGLTYREGLNAVAISGGVAGNVIPDVCTVTVNFRFAPDRSMLQAERHIYEIFNGFAIDIVDAAPAALPGLDRPLARAVVDAVGGTPKAKLGWTDVARYSELGIPAVNFGPGNPNLAHTREEHVALEQIRACETALLRFLSAPLTTADTVTA